MTPRIPNPRQPLDELGIIEVLHGPTDSNANLHRMFQEAADHQMSLRFLRIGAPVKFRMDVIDFADGRRVTGNHAYDRLSDERIPRIEFLLTNPFGEPFLSRMDNERRTNWQIWRIQQHILRFAEGLLFISRSRQRQGSLMVGFHKSVLMWNLGILGDDKVLIRSYGEEPGHGGATTEMVLGRGSRARLCESFIEYYESISYHHHTRWVSTARQLSDFGQENRWPGLFKGNAIKSALMDLDRGESEESIGATVAKICVNASAGTSEFDWLKLDESHRHELQYFRLPSLKYRKSYPWRGRALEMERIRGLSLFELMTEIHLVAGEQPELRNRAACVLGTLIEHSLNALKEFRSMGDFVPSSLRAKPYPYSAKLISALTEVYSHVSDISETDFGKVLADAAALGQTLERNAKLVFRDAHLKNRLILAPNMSSRQLAQSLLAMEPSKLAAALQTRVFDIDFESAHQKVTEWDDLAHVLFAENMGLISIECADSLIDAVKQCQLHDTIAPASADVLWKTVLARSTREFCRRLWYARVMPNTYYRRYGLEGREYYLDLAITAGSQISSLPDLNDFLKLCKWLGDSLWGIEIHPRSSIKYIKPQFGTIITAVDQQQEDTQQALNQLSSPRTTVTIRNYYLAPQLVVSVDFSTLATELGNILRSVRLDSDLREHEDELTAVRQAEIAAQDGNGSRALEWLARTGKWTLSVATMIGANVAAGVIRSTYISGST